MAYNGEVSMCDSGLDPEERMEEAEKVDRFMSPGLDNDERCRVTCCRDWRTDAICLSISRC
jgi:hypothetical protein